MGKLPKVNMEIKTLTKWESPRYAIKVRFIDISVQILFFSKLHFSEFYLMLPYCKHNFTYVTSEYSSERQKIKNDVHRAWRRPTYW